MYKFVVKLVNIYAVIPDMMKFAVF